MTERRTILGPYELIKGHWTSPRVDEGAIRMIEGKLYHAVDSVLDREDIMTQ